MRVTRGAWLSLVSLLYLSPLGHASEAPKDPAAIGWEKGSGPLCNECFIGNDCAELTPCYEYCNTVCDKEKKTAMDKRDAEKRAMDKEKKGGGF